MKVENWTSVSSTTEQVRGTYDDLAEEYYDRFRHPTCANFRDGCALVYEQWLPECWPRVGRICETGAGQSLVAEIATRYRLNTRELILLDSSPRMLAHSVKTIKGEYSAVLGNTLQLPFADQSISLLLATLGDPYNVPKFWQEVARVLVAHGSIIFTTPSHVWSSAFRREVDEEQNTAEFDTRDGRRILVPSFICPKDQQLDMMNTYGLQAKATMHVTLGQLESTTVSTKLRCASLEEIVTGYLVNRY